MFIGALKDFLFFCYEAAEKIEEKSKHFAEERRERMEAFRKEREEMRGEMKEKMERRKDEISEKVKAQVKGVLKESGLASKEEIDEIKTKLADISKKLEKLSK